MREPDKARQLRDGVRQLVLAHGALNPTQRPCGAALPLPRAYALLELLHNAGPMTVSNLATRLTIDATGVSRLCARMEEDGELIIEPDRDDRRARLLSLTPAGRKLARHVDTSSAGHFRRLLKPLGKDADGVIAALRRLSRIMKDEQ